MQTMMLLIVPCTVMGSLVGWAIFAHADFYVLRLWSYILCLWPTPSLPKNPLFSSSTHTSSPPHHESKTRYLALTGTLHSDVVADLSFGLTSFVLW